MLQKIIVLLLPLTLIAASNIYGPLYENLDKNENSKTAETLEQYVKKQYNVSAHEANYFLPISYRFEDNFGDPKFTDNPPSQMETEFQVSIKYDMFTNLLGLDEVYTFAYTQKSFWQLYGKSAYFRESNYNPEAFVTAPIDTSYLKGARIGFAHMSNGQGHDLERSWNYFYADLFFQLKDIFVDLKVWSSTNTSREKYNPDLLEYLGYGQLRFVIPYNKHLVETRFRLAEKGYAAEIDYSYPMFGREDLFVYVKGFSGYGESLIDYDVKLNKLGIGFSISR